MTASISSPGPRIALLTPYSGHNLGDAAIQDAMIFNLRARIPAVRISGITLNSVHFAQRHGSDAYDLAGANKPFYGVVNASLSTPAPAPRRRMLPRRLLGRFLRPGLSLVREIAHTFRTAAVLRGHSLLVVNGGGQLDDLWGGVFGHPLALFQWTLGARRARVPVVFASVGAGTLVTRLGRFFVAVSLRRACYRSYREIHTRELAMSLLPAAASDPVVPDLAFSLPDSALPAPRDLTTIARGRRLIAISPISFAKPGHWPSANEPLYNRYLGELSRLIVALEEEGMATLLVWSSLGDAASVVPDLLDRLPPSLRSVLVERQQQASIASWQDFVATVRSVDCLIASRLHSAILACVAATPTIALSFDPKIDWLMQDLGQEESLFPIAGFTAESVLGTIRSTLGRHADLAAALAAWRCNARPALDAQYDRIVKLALGSAEMRV